jgi:hypothetical protein
VRNQFPRSPRALALLITHFIRYPRMATKFSPISAQSIDKWPTAGVLFVSAVHNGRAEELSPSKNKAVPISFPGPHVRESATTAL